MHNSKMPQARRHSIVAGRDGVDHGGFTVIELIFVVAIIAMLIGLLLPAVQSAREAARRTQCMTRLSQLQLAVAGYHSTHSVLPPGTFSDALPVANYPNGYHHSWLVRILPWLEYPAVYRKIDFSRSVYRPANQFLFGEAIEDVLCPSSPMWRSTVSNFAAVYDGRAVPITEDSRGAFVANLRLSVDDVPDGFSRTLLASEKLGDPSDLGWPAGTISTLRTTGIPLGESNTQQARRVAMQGVVYTPDPYGWFLALEGTGDWNRQDDQNGSAGQPQEPAQDGAALVQDSEVYQSFAATPLALSAGFPAGSPKGQWYTPRGFASYHQGGVNAVMLDGSIEFLSESVDPRVYASLGIRDDGAPLAELR